MHLYCTNRDQHSVQISPRIKQGKAGPNGPPGVVNYRVVNETIKEHFNDISGQIQEKLTQIGPVVEKSNADIENLKAVMQQIQEQLGSLTTKVERIEQISTWYQAQNNDYYKLFHGKTTYAKAKVNCKRLGGQLASAGIRDEDVHREILHLVKSGESSTWIGLNDIQEENTFIWEDGVTATAGSIPWHDDQPDSYGGNQDCVEMRTSFDWELNDQGCTNKFKYLCEIEP
ncbi:lectin-like isoform X2 [Styela clava]